MLRIVRWIKKMEDEAVVCAICKGPKVATLRCAKPQNSKKSGKLVLALRNIPLALYASPGLFRLHTLDKFTPSSYIRIILSLSLHH